jgi:hypothetical protein
MTRVAFGVAVVAVALSGGVAMAQPPVWAGGPPPLNHIFGYSPLVPSVDPFPSRTSGYAQSMFWRNGGKRIEPLPARLQRPGTVIEYPTLPSVPEPAVVGGTVTVGPVVQVMPARGWHRFGR